MKKLVLAALLLSVLAFGAPARAECSGTEASAGISDVFHARFGDIKLDVRTIGSPLTVGQPPATAAGVCTDGSAGPTRGMHLLITDVSSNTTLCSMWTPDIGSYDPFGFGLVLGAGIRLTHDEAHPCGVAATWDSVVYATGVALNGYDPARLRFPSAEEDAFGSSVGIGVGAVVSGEIWWATGSVSSLTTGSDLSGSYARGVGVVNWVQ
jgi:hypothetical protein